MNFDDTGEAMKQRFIQSAKAHEEHAVCMRRSAALAERIFRPHSNGTLGGYKVSSHLHYWFDDDKKLHQEPTDSRAPFLDEWPEAEKVKEQNDG